MTAVIEDLGILAGENPGFFFEDPCAVPGHPATNEEHPPYYGYHMLPDGVLTPLYSCLATIASSDGSIYVTILYPFTLFRIDPIDPIAVSPSTHYGDCNAPGPVHDGLYNDNNVIRRCSRARLSGKCRIACIRSEKE